MSLNLSSLPLHSFYPLDCDYSPFLIPPSMSEDNMSLFVGGKGNVKDFSDNLCFSSNFISNSLWLLFICFIRASNLSSILTIWYLNIKSLSTINSLSCNHRSISFISLIFSSSPSICSLRLSFLNTCHFTSSTILDSFKNHIIRILHWSG